MTLSKISSQNKEREREIIDKILKCIDSRESMIFNSGAGAGKTYALIQGIKHTINTYNKNLKYSNQKIICITYTNVATDEVKERLGNTSLVEVSTIHDRLWELIKNYKKQLVQIHRDYLVEEIQKMQICIHQEDKYNKYKELSDNQKMSFNKIMNENKDLYYKSYSYKAAKFKEVFKSRLGEYDKLLSNVDKFKGIVNTIFKISNYESCIKNIDRKKSGYTSVVYDSKYNTDRLHKMRISHDTLLCYSFKLIQKYDLLKQVIIDKYPFIFIDEYQDTSRLVVQIMNCLDQYANKIGHSFFIGYFGDSAQNIYGDGVGKQILEIHPNLKIVDKEFNRRSTQEIINIANRIRNDYIVQTSIYEDCTGGNVKFYVGKSDDVGNFINEYIDKWKIEINNPLHCFVLTNKTVAKYVGFEDIYNTFAKMEIYKGQNYNQLNTELLNEDSSKLGEIPNLLFRIIKLNNYIENKNTQIKNIIPDDIGKDMSFKQLMSLIEIFKGIRGSTLQEYVNKVSEAYYKDKDGKYKIIVERTFDMDHISVETFKGFLMKKLFPNTSSNENSEIVIQELLNISMNQYKLWYEYITNKFDGKLTYHTYHGTKGLEFDNVIIIMENAFGKDKNYFNFFFKNYNCSDELEIHQINKFEKIKNLLYVSVTRSIKNLRILYTDDICDFKNEVEDIFDNIYIYNKS